MASGNPEGFQVVTRADLLSIGQLRGPALFSFNVTPTFDLLIMLLRLSSSSLTCRVLVPPLLFLLDLLRSTADSTCTSSGLRFSNLRAGDRNFPTTPKKLSAETLSPLPATLPDASLASHTVDSPCSFSCGAWSSIN